MSTQTSFDLAGLSRAIQSQDRRYQLALYADNAELEILDSSHLEPPLQVLHGQLRSSLERDGTEGETPVGACRNRFRLVPRVALFESTVLRWEVSIS
jgi:hypothetical protein